MSDGIGYLLPEGDAYTNELGCTIVFYPDRNEYRRALLGSLHYLATWTAWERDAAKRGKDAARAWKNANDETMECWQMACLDGLIADVAAIRQMIGLLSYCCDGTITYDPPTVVDPPFVPGVGDPPDNYGETPIEDWDEWTEYACYNADAYVDYLIEQATNFASVAQTGAWTLGLVAAALALLSFTGIGLPISFALASTVLFGLLQASSGTFDGVADDLEAARDDIRCAIIRGESLEDAVGAAIGTGSLAWTLLFSHVDYGSAASIIQSGGYGDEYLPAQTSTDCNGCVVEADTLLFQFATAAEGWDTTNGFAYDGARQLLSGQISGGDRFTSVTAATIRTLAGLGASEPIQLQGLTIDVTGWALACTVELKVFVWDGSTQYDTAYQVYTGAGSPGTTVNLSFATPYAGDLLWLGVYAKRICGGGSQFVFLDNIEVAYYHG